MFEEFETEKSKFDWMLSTHVSIVQPCKFHQSNHQLYLQRTTPKPYNMLSRLELQLPPKSAYKRTDTFLRPTHHSNWSSRYLTGCKRQMMESCSSVIFQGAVQVVASQWRCTQLLVLSERPMKFRNSMSSKLKLSFQTFIEARGTAQFSRSHFEWVPCLVAECKTTCHGIL